MKNLMDKEISFEKSVLSLGKEIRNKFIELNKLKNIIRE